MFLITIDDAGENVTQELASVFGGVYYAPGALSFEKPSEVGEIARYLCKARKSFEVQSLD